MGNSKSKTEPQPPSPPPPPPQVPTPQPSVPQSPLPPTQSPGDPIRGRGRREVEGRQVHDERRGRTEAEAGGAVSEEESRVYWRGRGGGGSSGQRTKEDVGTQSHLDAAAAFDRQVGRTVPAQRRARGKVWAGISQGAARPHMLPHQDFIQDCDKMTPVTDYRNAATSVKASRNAATPGRGNWNAALPVKDDWNANIPVKDYCNADAPVKIDWNATTSVIKDDRNVITPVKVDWNAVIPAKNDWNETIPFRNDWNANTNMKDDWNATLPVKNDWHAHIPVEDDWNAALPAKDDRNSAIPVKDDWNVTNPVKDDWNVAILVEDDWDVAIPVKDDWNVANPVKDDLNEANPVKDDWNVAILVEDDWNVANPVKNDLNVAIPFKDDWNVVNPVKDDWNVGIPIKDDWNVAITVKDDWNAATPIKDDRNSAIPDKVDWNVAIPVKEDWNAAISVKDWVAVTPVKKDKDVVIRVKEDCNATIFVKDSVKDWDAANPVKENDAAATCIKKDRGAANHVKEEVVAATPVKESSPAVTPVKENVAAATLVKENVAAATRVKENVAAATRVKENVAAATRVKENVAAATRVKENVAAATRVKENVAAATRVKENVAAATRVKENVAAATRVKENIAAANLVKENVAAATRVKENVAAATRVKENVAAATLVKENVAAATRVKENVAAATRVKENVAAATRVKENVAAATRVKENVAAATRVKENVAAATRVKENVAAATRVKENVAAATRVKENVAAATLVKENVAAATLVKENVAAATRVKENVAAATLVKENVAAATRVKENVAAATRVKENVAAATLVKENVAAATLVKENVAAATRVKENVAAATLVKENVAAATRVKENVAAATLVKENVAAATRVNENVAAATLVKENVAAATLVKENVAAATLVKENVAAATRVKENVAAATLVKENVAAATLVKENVAAATRVKENVAAATLVKENVAAATRVKENVAAATLVKENVAAATLVKENVAAATRVKENVAAATLVKENVAAATRVKENVASATLVKENVATATRVKENVAAGTRVKENVAAATLVKENVAAGTRVKKNVAAATRVKENVAAATLVKENVAAATLVKENVAAATRVKENVAAGTRVKEGGAVATPVKEGGAVATPVKEGGAVATPVKEGGAVATPVKEGGTVVIPVKEGGTVVIPVKESSAFAIHVKEGGSAAIPVKEDGAAVTPVKENGTATVHVKEGNATATLVKKNGTAVIPVEEDNDVVTPVKKGGAAATPVRKGVSTTTHVRVGGVTNNKTTGTNKARKPRKKPKQKLTRSQGERVRPCMEVERSYDLHLHQITRRAEEVLTRHYDKIAEVEEQLEALHQGRRNLSLEEFAERLKSRLALEDRQQELGLQKDEFLRHMEDVLDRLNAARDARNFETVAIELRKDMATECGRLANAFPIYARRTDIVTTVKQNQVCVIIGETGSGKSTQMAQFFLQEGVAGDGVVACTQPRKIAATSLATHVALEMGSEVGHLVGYKVGMQARRKDSTKILYMTDHVLLNECLQDPTLARYSCVIIDEAHERSIYTDLLLGMLRTCLRKRPELRIVITSATIKPDVFVRYFGKCPVVNVSGRMFPVEVEWQETQAGVDNFKNYQEAAVRKAVEVHRSEGEGDVLVFLTSPAETERCCQMFRDQLEGHPENYVVQQLHGRLQSDEQQQVFHPAPEGRRKVVFATNSAETSVTIPGVKFVIDTGLVKEMKYDPVRRINSLTVTLVSQSSARQRQGRAGRLGPGKCFRLYTEQDYDKMAPDALPEILRVHVGHAMLKLMELGVDPMQFEYIESPSTEALETALASLEVLGAVAEGRITDLGRWAAKMPFDPRYGVLVHDAARAGAGLEAIVVAATSGCGSVFYRGGSVMEKEAADKKKVRFCHEGGDQLTALNVFREWHQVSERNQGRWCLTHAINGKTMRAIRETTREVLNTLDKELHAGIPFKFGDTRAMDTILEGLLFRSLSPNLSHYLGHLKAGYAPAFKEQRVELHPSCALLPLGHQPEWLVFEQVMRTSRDFAMQVTPVKESAVLQAVRDGWLQLDLEAAKRKRLVVACREAVGPQLFREVVGPRYTLLRTLEEKLAASYPSCVVVVEAMEEKGELRVLSSQQHRAALADSFADVVPPLRTKFRAEESEEPVGKRSQHGGVRVVVGAGGVVTDLLMPEEYTAVLVTCCRDAVHDLSEGKVALALRRHGPIKECIKFFRKNNNSTLWGKVVFEKREAAAAAVQESCDKQAKEKDRRAQQEYEGDAGKEEDPDGTDDLQLNVRPNVRAAGRRDAAFTAKIQWCRRPSKGFGYVSFVNVEDFMRAQAECVNSGISVGGSRARVKPARQEQQSLHVSNFGPLVTEDVLRAAFAEKLNLHPTRDLTKVVVVRLHKPLDPEHRRTCERRLRHKVEEFAPRESFHLEVLEPRSERNVNFVGFCNFNSPEQGHAACAAIDNNFYLETVISMRPNIRSSLFVHADVYEQCGPQVEALVQEFEGEQVRLAVKKLKNNNVIVELHSDSVAALAHVRARLQEVVTGDVVECGSTSASVALFSREGKRLLKEVMDRTHTLVLTDTRLKTVSIHGSAPQRQAAREQIMEQLRLLTDHRQNLQLRDGGRPRGLMKALMMKYGTDLEGLRDAAGLGAVTLNLRYHRLGLCGPRQAVEKASQAVEAVATNLPQEEAPDPADDQPDCAACLCPVEDGTLCRLECCGHAYCRECLAQQVNTALTSRTFPVECIQEGCGAPLARRDFVNLSRWGQLTLARWVEAAVAAHVQGHQRALHYCITPDCPAVYRTTEQGALFVCPECEARACTACHVQYHEGLTCAMYRSAGKDTGFGKWMAQDPSRRKVCPSCTTPLEKVEGCNKVFCTACKKVLCWMCLAVFPSQDECYRHLRNSHGGY